MLFQRRSLMYKDLYNNYNSNHKIVIQATQFQNKVLNC